jgi:tryptophanase
MSEPEDIPLEQETLAEPYRIKMVEKAHLLPRSEREKRMRDASFSVVHLNSEDIFIDLMTDSGTGAMSDQQWSALMRGDEAYMGAKSFFELEREVRDIMPFHHVIPTHQGRAAEHILMELLLGKDKDEEGKVVLSNTHFDTTRAHVLHRNATPLDLFQDSLFDFEDAQPFKGNFDLKKLEHALAKYGKRVGFVLITVLNNFACSAPVSMENIEEASRLARRAGKPVFFDACRFAENAYFIKTREEKYKNWSIRDIVQEMLKHGDGCWMSAKKDAIVNIGGFIALKKDQDELAQLCKERGVLYEGFPSYGGLAGRDLAAMAVGLREGIEEEHLAHRTGQVKYLAGLFKEAGIKTSMPAGGSGVFIDVDDFYSHVPANEFRPLMVTSDLYLEGGIRGGAYPFHYNTLSVKKNEKGEIIGSEEADKVFNFARFAIPRRTYTKSHLDYVGKAMARLKKRADAYREKGQVRRGLRIKFAPKILPHFFARFERVEPEPT